MCKCAYVYMCACLYVCMCVYVYVFVYVYVKAYVYDMYVGMYVCMYVCMYTCIYVYMLVCMHVFVCEQENDHVHTNLAAAVHAVKHSLHIWEESVARVVPPVQGGENGKKMPNL